jgi:hypothetical protein
MSMNRDGWLILTLIACLLASMPATIAAQGPDFEKSVAPILVRRCLECHSGDDPAGELSLTTLTRAKAVGDSGPAIVVGSPDKSPLVTRVEAGEMPLDKNGEKGQPLPKAESDVLRAWIAAGASWPSGRTLDPYESSGKSRAGRDWWALQPVRRPPVAAVAASPIDALIRRPLAARKWEPAPQADRRTLIRRLSFDLVGLPPTTDQIEAFIADRSPDAYEKLVDKLLASVHFGERYARHWLDVARYAETCGYERDQAKPHAWKYRDWVVGAFNSDLPYDRFILEQLAGDELADRCEKTVIATGFLRLGTWNDEPNDPQEYKYERLEDMVHATSTAFLALTVKCARCHDHKFDPVPQRDYYRTAAAFWAGPIEPGPRELLGGPTKEQLGFDVLGWTDRGSQPPPLRLLKKGDPNQPRDEIPFGFLSLIPMLDASAVSPAAGATTTGRRLALARWMADAKNPLTARVWVNRLWQHHFGAGIVGSPDNFGFAGEKPTHPELLDFLASELVRNGWQSKPIHRMMVTSATYKQASMHPKQAEYAGLDSANRLWWRAARRRLDAESLRDGLLFAAGQLNAAHIGGPSFVPQISAEALAGWSRKGSEWQPSPRDQQCRRTLYAFVKRGLLPPTLTTFDAPDTTLPCGQRDVTTVAPQALALLNNSFVHEQSEALAHRAAAGAVNEIEFVRRAWRFALGRQPAPAEETAAVAHLKAQAARLASPAKARASLCHVLLNTNEFIYID